MVRFMGKPVQTQSVLLGVAIGLGACIVPVISNIVSPVVASIRNKVSAVGGVAATTGAKA